jgi:hypothetical protein
MRGLDLAELNDWMIQINTNPSGRDLRQFSGIWFPLFCAMIGLIVYRRFGYHTPGVVIWVIGAAIALAGLAKPAIVKPVFIGMMYASFPIGWVMTHILLGVMYFGVLTPIGLMMRLAGRDTMTRKFDPAAASYWIPREQVTGNERYFRQY